jgi:hypothetical protein
MARSGRPPAPESSFFTAVRVPGTNVSYGGRGRLKGSCFHTRRGSPVHAWTMEIERRFEALGLGSAVSVGSPCGGRDSIRLGSHPGRPRLRFGARRIGSGWFTDRTLGKVPVMVSLHEAQNSARLATVAMLASLKGVLGDLDRVRAWLMVNGHVNAEPGYPQTTAVLPVLTPDPRPLRGGARRARSNGNRRRRATAGPARGHLGGGRDSSRLRRLRAGDRGNRIPVGEGNLA